MFLLNVRVELACYRFKVYQIERDIFSGNYSDIAQKLVQMVFQVPIKMLGDMVIETCHYLTLIEMGVACTFLISIQGNYRIDCI